MLAAGAVLPIHSFGFNEGNKLKVALVGTGIRGISFWGKRLVEKYYGSYGPFRGDKCRTSEHKTNCEFYWDITKDEHQMNLYFVNEKYDGYIRDNCLFRSEINIYDKMSAQVKYKNNVILNYSLTTYSLYEGWRVGFNGTKGRIEAWKDIPYFNEVKVDQAELHAREMDQDKRAEIYNEQIVVHNL